MAAPVCTHVREVLEAMGNPVVELRFVRIGLGVGLRDTLGDHFRIALLVAGVVAV